MTLKKRNFMIVLLPILLIGGFSLITVNLAGRNVGDTQDVDQIMAVYKGWKLLTPKPKNISPMLWGLCRAPTKQEQAFLSSVHADLYLKIYVNDVGFPTLAQQESVIFPVGTVIVKEKLIGEESAAPESLGMMIKRPKGFNPSGGDWEYVYWKKGSEIARGPKQLENCQTCHVAKSDTDSVFHSYVGGW